MYSDKFNYSSFFTRCTYYVIMCTSFSWPSLTSSLIIFTIVFAAVCKVSTAPPPCEDTDDSFDTDSSIEPPKKQDSVRQKPTVTCASPIKQCVSASEYSNQLIPIARWGIFFTVTILILYFKTSFLWLDSFPSKKVNISHLEYGYFCRCEMMNYLQQQNCCNLLNVNIVSMLVRHRPMCQYIYHLVLLVWIIATCCLLVIWPILSSSFRLSLTLESYQVAHVSALSMAV